MSTAQSLAALLPWLAYDGETPASIPFELVEETWLAPLCFIALGEEAHRDRSKFNATFTQSFERRARLESAWRESLKTLESAAIEVLTLGSLPFAESLYAHAGARFSQDIDLLVLPKDEAKAKQALENLGWVEHPRLRILERDGLQLDLHTTPGEETRTPAIARLFGQTTEHLFANSRAHPAGGLALKPEALLNNRVIHFFKHACEKPLHGLEIALLLREPYSPSDLKSEIETTKSERIWAFVLALLERWNLIAGDLLPEVSREKVDQGALLRAANLELGFGTYRLIASWMPLRLRLTYALQIAWPSRDELLKTYASPDLGLGERSKLRALRLKKFLHALLA